jgi:hypothetical protein
MTPCILKIFFNTVPSTTKLGDYLSSLYILNISEQSYTNIQTLIVPKSNSENSLTRFVSKKELEQREKLKMNNKIESF